VSSGRSSRTSAAAGAFSTVETVETTLGRSEAVKTETKRTAQLQTLASEDVSVVVVVVLLFASS